VSEVLRLILANALTAGLLALAAWVASRRVRRQSLVHGLWLLALVKLVTPPVLPLPLLPEWTMPSLGLAEGPAVVVIPYASRGPRSPAWPEAAPGHRSTVAPGESTVALPERRGTTFAAPAAGITARPLGGEARPAPWDSFDPASLAWAGLLAGALVVATLAFLRIRRFQRLLGLGIPAAPALSGRVAELAERVGLRQAPPALLLPARVPPMLWPGRTGPLLLIPAGLLAELSEEERDTLLVHELAHVRRRDHWVRFLELAVTILFWWYPVAWWVRRALRRAEERCCDEWVLRVMPGSAGAYAGGLLKSLDLLAGEPDPLPIGASGAGPVHDLEARLKEILMTTRPTPTLATPARLLFAAVALLGLAVFPTRAQSPPPEPDPDPAVSSPAEAPPGPAAVPEAPEIADTATVVPEAPAPPAPPALPAEASPPDAPSAPAPPARPADSPAPTLAAPTLPAIPVEPAPAVAPAPEPAPAAPAPRVPDAALAPPPPAPHPAPRAVPAPAPPAPRPGTAPLPIVAPGAEETPEDQAARREIEEQQRKLEAQRAALHRRQLELARERLSRDAHAQQAELRAEAARLRAAGEADRAALVEEHAQAAARRRELQEREIALEQAQLAEQTKGEEKLRATTEDLRALEREGRHAEAAELQEKLATLEQEHARRSLELDEKRLALQREAMEVEHQAQQAEMKLAQTEARRGHEAMATELERERERREWEHGLQQREMEAQAAAQAAQAKELEARALEDEGRRDEAAAARAEAEERRQEAESLQRAVMEDHLLRSTTDLELQMESQLEALRHLRAEGADDDAAVQDRIRRLEAALGALHGTEE
jgi:hypothetical protein